MIEGIIVTAVVLAAIAFAGYTFYKYATGRGGGCHTGCGKHGCGGGCTTHPGEDTDRDG